MEIYTPIEDAGRIIKERWENEVLRKKVVDKLKGDIPSVLENGPSGMIWRHIVTPDREFERFLDLCSIAKVKPVCFEYINDKFIAGNFTKFGLTNLPFSKGLNKNNKNIVERRKIINFEGAEGKKMSELNTLWGENLVEFHHLFLSKVFSIEKKNIFDLSDWVFRHGISPDKYYSMICTFSVCHSIFFDDFDLIDSENDFTNKIVIPALKKVEEEFGVKPIVVKISKPKEHLKDPYWWCYTKEAEEIMNEHIKQYKTND